MKKSIIIWGMALVLVVVALVVTSQKPPQNKQQDLNTPKTSDAQLGNAPAFTLKDLDGNTVSLSDFRGKRVYVNFFATWCPPCRGEMPDIEKMFQKYKDRGLVVLAVDLGEDNATVKNYIQSSGYNFKVLLDPDKSVENNYNTQSIPVSVFIDKDGNIVSRRVGALTIDDMERNIRLLGF